MNLDSLSFALSQISYSVANLTKKTFKTSVAEISHLIAQHGAEVDRHLFRCLFSHVEFSGDGKGTGKDLYQTQYLSQECVNLITKPNFVSILCYSIDYPLHHQKSLKPSSHLLSQVSKILKLNKVQEVAFGLALLHSSFNETRQHATQFLKNKLPQLLNAYIDADSGTGSGEDVLKDCPIEVLHLLLNHLTSNSSGSPEQYGVTQQHIRSLLTLLRKEFPRERVPVVLAPALYPEIEDLPIDKVRLQALTIPNSTMEGSMADMLPEIGYGFTSSPDECRNTLNQFGGARELTPTCVARILAMMARTSSCLSDPVPLQSLGLGAWGDTKDKMDAGGGGPNTWNVDIFVQVVRELNGELKWREVVGELDHSGMHVTSKAGLRLIVQGLLRGLAGETFPIEYIYRLWKNTEGQLSWITHSLNNPDVFCFADFGYHPVSIDILKTPPDEENRDIATWKSLELVEILLRLSEAGHYQSVSDLFKFPVMHCPDMLVLALLKIRTWNTLKHELLSSLMPTFLGNHPNSASVLQHAWHCQGQSTTIRTLVMHSMAEWYMRGDHHDQSRLGRILDVAQDLKALSMLLNATPFAFVIDLACLASRREYLKLDKWLSDKIREHGEPFTQAAMMFLKRRCPQLMGGQALKDDTPQAIAAAKSQQLPPDTIGLMLTCLRTFIMTGNVSQELSDAVLTMLNNAGTVINKARQEQATAGSLGAIGGPRPGPAGAPAPIAAPTPSNPQMEPLVGMMPGIGGPPTPGVGALPNTSLPSFPGSSLSSVAAPPSSPSKAFPALAGLASQQVASTPQPLNTFQALTSQIQSLSLQSTMSTGITARGTPTLGMGTSLKQPAPDVLRKDMFGTAGNIGPQVGSGPVSTAPSVVGGGGGSDLSAQPAVNQHFSKEIEDEANSYFQRIYNHPPHPTISIDEVLEMLKRFKDSPNNKEKEVFACMLRNLFEEYKFFPQYPDKELHTTAVLFGGIIEQGLVTYVDLGIALRFVLDALKKPHSTKMYVFGIAALDRFKTRLKDYPQYCQVLASIPHFAQFPGQLKEYVEHGTHMREPPARLVQPSMTSPPPPPQPPTAQINPPATQQAPPATVVMTTAATTTTTASAATTTTSTASTSASHGAIARPSGVNSSRPSIANATNIDTLLAGTEGKEEVSVPPEATQDKVFFIFNNLSLANMDQKCLELKENVTDEFLPWVAQYLVMKRASIEHNFHTLYAHFIDHLKKDDFIHMVIRETFRNIKVLLRSDKGVANFSDRSLLKNLGHWLGMLTLARNKPILQLDIDLKSLLYEAYHKGSQELLYVVPFVAKVVESCAKSKVFKPINPWTMAVMNVLAELHAEPDLKLNLKFEIEVLCKTLNLDINDLQPGNYLKDRSRFETLEHQLSSSNKVKTSSSTPQPEEPLQINMPTPTTTVAAATVVTTATTTTTTPVVVPPQPQFGYHEINILSSHGLNQHITLNEQLALFQAHPQLKQVVRSTIERAVQEILTPLVERSIKIALITCEQIVKKDFALDPEESRMQVAAHHMVRFMTAGMALITCREPLLNSIAAALKNAFQTAMGGMNSTLQNDVIEQTAQVIAQDNVELCCAFIQKTAVERAIPEMDKRLTNDYELRKLARNENRRYCDPVVLTYQAERMPEQIRLKVGGVTHQQVAVYEEFARNIPGFIPAAQEAGISQAGAAAAAMGAMIGGSSGGLLPYNSLRQVSVQRKDMEPQFAAADEIIVIYDKMMRDLEHQVNSILVPSAGNASTQLQALQLLVESVQLARNSHDIVTALALLQKAVEGLLDGLTATNATTADNEMLLRYRDCHLLVLKALQDPRAYGPQWTNKQVTRCLIECREEYRYNIEAVDCLIRSELVNMPQYDVHLAQCMENGLNYMAVAFAMQLVQRFCAASDSGSGEKHDMGPSESDFFNTVETLARIASHSRQAPDGLSGLLDTIRQHGDSNLLDRAAVTGPVSMMQSGISQAREFDDPPGLHEKTEYLLREWVSMYHLPAAGRDSTKAFSAFVGQMHQQGILRTDDLITRFFRLCTEMCVDLCYQALTEHNQSPSRVRNQCFHTLDAFVRLIALLVKHSGDTANTVTKINLLNKVLGIVAGVLLQDHEVRHQEFQQLSYHRIFIMLFIELNAPEHILENINFQVLTAFCNTLHILRPAKAPGFAFAWLELVSHRVFMGRMLAITPQQRGWSMYAQLLVDLFKYLAPFLRNAELNKATQMLYKGTLRVLLVLLHDFPEFLCDYHYTFCDVIPPNCIQMRNLILSAYPRNMRLPDPFTPNLKVDMLPEISHAPRIMFPFTGMIQPASVKKDLDSYLKTRSPVTFLSELRTKLQVSNEPGMRYNIPVMNALVLHVGTQAIAFIHSKGLTPSMSTIAHSSHMDIFQNLAVDLDTEGRYLFLNAIVNQLRYPNSHTHYFSCTLLYLFAEANAEAIQEQITRVLLERLIVNRPHPWGLLITFIELIKNPQFKFWNHEFVHCAPEISKLFDCVARSCMQPRQTSNLRENEAHEVVH